MLADDNGSLQRHPSSLSLASATSTFSNHPAASRRAFKEKLAELKIMQHALSEQVSSVSKDSETGDKTGDRSNLLV
jgi:hypothetical protein